MINQYERVVDHHTRKPDCTDHGEETKRLVVKGKGDNDTNDPKGYGDHHKQRLCKGIE